ncbi:MAG TPA: hypothetical protein VI547_02995, partial [Anaerolineales bacterium]|nr:hypothetical protein [Anaerolineales bacterium]
MIFFIGSTGCMTMLCLCVLAIIARPLQSYMLTLLSILAERSAYPKLNAEKLVDLGSVTGVAFSPDGERILVRGEWRYDEETTEELAHFTLYDKQGNLIVDLGEAEWGY